MYNSTFKIKIKNWYLNFLKS